MRVCLVTPEYPPLPCGGAGTYCILFAAELAARGHAIHVLTKGAPGAPARETRADGVEVHRIPFEDNQGRSVWDHWSPFVGEMTSQRSYIGVFSQYVADRLPDLIREHGIDLVEFQDLEAPGYFYLNRRLYDPDIPAVPTVVRLHGMEDICVAHNGGDVWSRATVHRVHYEHTAVALADGVLAPSAYYARQVEHVLARPAGSIPVVPYPCGPLPTPGAGAPVEGPPKILLVGRLERRKGGEVLLRALGPLRAEFPGLRARFVGRDTEFAPTGGRFIDFLKRRIPPGAEGDVQFDAFMPRETLWPRYAQAAVCVVPSLWDNYPYVCLEAMAAGALMVVSDGGGMAEMVEDGVSGFICPAGDPDALASALRRALTLPPAAAAAMRAAAAERARGVGDNHQVMDRHLAFYEDIRARHAVGALPPRFDFNPHPRGPVPPAASVAAPAVSAAPPGRVAVIVPCYNLGAYLDECLASIAASTRPPDEVLIMDDGSTDPATRATLDRLRAAGHRVERTANQGLAATRNTGAARVTADYLVFLDADDKIAPTYLEHAARALDRLPDVAAAGAWVQAFEGMQTLWAPFHPSLPFLLYENQFHPAAMVRRAAFLAAGGQRPAMAFGYEDWDFWLKLIADGGRLFMLPEVGIHYRIRAGSMLQGFRRATHVMMRECMLARFAGLARAYGPELAGLADRRHDPPPPAPAETLAVAEREELERWRRAGQMAQGVFRHPLASLRYLLPRMRARLAPRRRP